MVQTGHFQELKAGDGIGPDGSRTARQPCRRPPHADPALAGFPLHHRGRRRAGRAADTDRLVALLHPFARAPRPSRRRGLVAVLGGDRHLGTQRPRRLGVGHHELRLLGRYRSRRHAHLRDPVPLPPEVAHVDQPLRGGDDHLRGHVRRDVPGIHVGRVWVAYWMFPIPNQMGIWPNFRSPLLWDVFAVTTYFTVSLLFWYVGLIPDLATMRDRAKTRIRQIRLRHLRPRLAGLQPALAPLRDAPTCSSPPSRRRWSSRCTRSSPSTSPSRMLPGWHTTIFPPYFVAGAIFSGFAMVLTLHGDLRADLRPPAPHHAPAPRLHGEDHARDRVDRRLRLRAWSSSSPGTAGTPTSCFAFLNRAFGPYAWAYWTMISCNVIVPQLFWFKKARTSIPIMFVAVDLHQHRHVVRALRHHRDVAAPRLPAFVLGLLHAHDLGRGMTARELRPLLHDVLLFVRFLPMIAIAEVKAVLPQADPHWRAGPEREISRPPRPAAVPSGSQRPAEMGLRDRRSCPAPEGAPLRNPRRFATPTDLYHACEGVRDAGFTRWDAHSPFPVHGLDRAMGLRRPGFPGLSSAWDCGGRVGVRPAVVGPRRRLPPRD